MSDILLPQDLCICYSFQKTLFHVLLIPSPPPGHLHTPMKHSETSSGGMGPSVSVSCVGLSGIWEAGLGLGKEEPPGAPGLGSGCPEEASEGKLAFHTSGRE